MNNNVFENLSYNWSEDSMRLFSTPSAKTREALLYVQETGYFNTAPDYYAERENLNSYLILHTLSGEGTLNYLGNNYALTKNSTMYIDCRKHHLYRCAKDKEWSFLWLHFYGSGSNIYYETYSKSREPVFKSDISKKIEDWLSDIIELTRHRSIYSEYMCANLISNIVTELIVQEDDQTLLKDMPDYLSQALRLIDHRYKKKITLDTLAKEVGISKYYLSREFKNYIGENISDYLLDKRINYAKKLLRFSAIPIYEIAEKCGFGHVPHFISQFKKREGVTPLAYRKEWQ